MNQATLKPEIKAAPPQKAKRRLPKARTVATVVACQVAALLAVEGVLAWAGIGEEEIFRFDKQLGFVHIPNKRITWRSEGYATSYFDANGLREKNITVAKPADTIRVALLGDSLTEGLQVPYEESFAHLIQERIGDLKGKQLQVINFGCSGYSTTQELLLLERQVLKFSPDLVIVCYNSRDLIENWSTADQVVTNVRPSAVHLPGGWLYLDDYTVKKWFKSPRGSFLDKIAWIREHSRIWGVYSAVELQLSQRNPVAKAVLNFWSNPTQVFRDSRTSLAAWFKDLRHQKATLKLPTPDVVVHKPKFSTAGPAQAPATPAPVLVPTPPAAAIPAPPVAAAVPAPPATAQTTAQAITPGAPAAVASPAPPKSMYRTVVFQTMSSLLDRMNKDCSKQGARLMVAAMPVRSALAPTKDYEQEFAGINYAEEVSAVKGMCDKQGIPFCDVETLAEKLSLPSRQRLFYTAHLTPVGHSLTANILVPFVRKECVQFAQK